MLKEVDLDVRFTRMSDKYVSLGDRVEFANNFGADYFLSIHVNSASDNTCLLYTSKSYYICSKYIMFMD